jgi:hypothetical protein
MKKNKRIMCAEDFSDRVTLSYKGKILDQWYIDGVHTEPDTDVLENLCRYDETFRNGIIDYLESLGFSDMDEFRDGDDESPELYFMFLDELQFEYDDYKEIYIDFNGYEIFTGETVED